MTKKLHNWLKGHRWESRSIPQWRAFNKELIYAKKPPQRRTEMDNTIDKVRSECVKVRLRLWITIVNDRLEWKPTSYKPTRRQWCISLSWSVVLAVALRLHVHFWGIVSLIHKKIFVVHAVTFLWLHVQSYHVSCVTHMHVLSILSCAHGTRIIPDSKRIHILVRGGK